jgi:hypothetical protein
MHRIFFSSESVMCLDVTVDGLEHAQEIWDKLSKEFLMISTRP